MSNLTNAPLTLVSHLLCPYVQRAAIVLAEKGVSFDRRNIDLANKPDWFLKLSPLGKTPVLLVCDQPIFESAAICEYLEDTLAPSLHPRDALKRAQHRAWMEFGSTILNSITGFYNAADESLLTKHAQVLTNKFKQIEEVLSEEGPYFSGSDFCIVDTVFGPIFRYFDTFDRIANFGILEGLSKVNKWREAMAKRESVKNAVRDDYPKLLHEFLVNRNSALSIHMANDRACAMTTQRQAALT
jgi:glutathione S-transferase